MSFNVIDELADETEEMISMFWTKKKKPELPSTLAVINITPLIIMQSAEILYVADVLKNRNKSWLGGTVIEVMISTPAGAPFFIYYENDEYYYRMAAGRQSLTDPHDNEDYRRNASFELCRFLVAYVHQQYGKDIRHPQMQFSHNRIHTNVIAYVERLRQWYPIQQSDSEGDSAAEIKVARVNNGQSKIGDCVATDSPSPS